MLKGGNALVTREPNAARASLDLDLAARRTRERLDTLLKDLEDAAAVDLGDHFRFVTVRRREHHGATQPNVVGYQLTIAAYCGIKNVDTIKIDLVTGTLITGTPQSVTRSSLAIDGLAPVVVTCRRSPLLSNRSAGNDTLIWPHRDGLIWPRQRHSGAVMTV